MTDWQPTHEEVAILAEVLWRERGGGETTRQQADANWLESEEQLRMNHVEQEIKRDGDNHAD